LLWLGVVAPLTLYAAVVLESPPDILDRFQALKRFSEAVREHLLEVCPAFDIHQHALSTAFPQVAMLASSLGVLLVAYIAAAFCAANASALPLHPTSASLAGARHRESRWRSRCPTAGRAFFGMGGVLSSRGLEPSPRPNHAITKWVRPGFTVCCRRSRRRRRDVARAGETSMSRCVLQSGRLRACAGSGRSGGCLSNR